MAPKVNASSSRRGAPAVFKSVLHVLDATLGPGMDRYPIPLYSKYLVFTAYLANLTLVSARKNPAEPPPRMVP